MQTKRIILNDVELGAALVDLKGWSVAGNCLKRRWEFENFAAALEFVNRVSALAEAADHHPDISFGWGYAELLLTTHDRGGITDVDTAMASQINGLS